MFCGLLLHPKRDRYNFTVAFISIQCIEYNFAKKESVLIFIFKGVVVQVQGLRLVEKQGIVARSACDFLNTCANGCTCRQA